MSLFSSLRSAGSLPVEGHLPGFEGATGWLNSPPLADVASPERPALRERLD